MAVVVVSRRYISCDEPGCERASARYAKAKQARAELAKIGWGSVDGADYCPPHYKKHLDQKYAERSA